MDNHSASSNEQQQQQETADQHEHEVEEHEAYQYWGYLFKPDKTGTDRLKGLLRGLKELMNTHYEPSENPDLTPTQLASFYRELHGNYDRLFLGTPSESIAFIYKSLGCLHSLQPLPHSTAFTEPSVPALKTEGWIMWQTIQLLLGPNEHSSFLMEAVQKWEIKDPATGEVLPKILPRQCFPMEPDKHMVAWYEGVSERLRREAEDEERQREVEAEQAEVRRLQYRKRDDVNDDESVDSRKSALAYFRDPLYRQDGRPTIVRPSSRRPHLSPRRSSMKDKAKEGATTVGHVIRNIGSPHLWDGRGSSRNENRDRSRDHRRRSSLPENHYRQSSDGPPLSTQNSRTSSYASNHSHHRRERSGQPPQQDVPPGPEDGFNADDEDTPVNSRAESRSRNQNQSAADDNEPTTLRQSRSAEPTPTQTEITDYFYNYEDASNRSSSKNVTPNGVGPSFGPSASPLFASHIAKQPQPQAAPPPAQPRPMNYHPQADYGPSRSSRHGGPPRSPPSGPPDDRRRPYSRSPHHSDRPHSHNHNRDRDRDRDDRDRRYSSRPRSSSHRYDRSPGRGGPPPPPSYSDGAGRTSAPGYPPIGSDYQNRSGSSQLPYPSSGQGYPSIPGGPPGGGSSGSLPPPRERRRSARMSGSDLSGGGGGGGEDERRGSGADDMRRGSGSYGQGQQPPKQARFASVGGVDGRKYPNESPWR